MSAHPARTTPDPAPSGRRPAGRGTVPARITTDDGAVAIRRAWPGNGGRLTIEAADDAGRIRAGVLRAGAVPFIAPYALDPALPALADMLGHGQQSPGHKLLVHRYKRRAVIHTSNAFGTRFTKVLPAGKAERIAAVSERMHRVCASAGIAVPAVLGYGVDRVVFAGLEGLSFHDHGGPGNAAAWSDAWARWADLWPRLVTSVHAPGLLQRYGADDEARTVQRWAEHAGDFGAFDVPVQRLQALTSAVVAGLVEGPSGKAGLSHRDLHDKQLFYAPESNQVGLLDFDTAALAELALDIANLSVHLELRRDQQLISAPAFTAARSSIEALKQHLDVEPVRVAAYERSTRLRLTCLYGFRPAWHQLATRWLAHQLKQLDEKTLMRL